ncbi:hypothetical protein ACFL53_00455 [Pseudomonadota bacterium]
MTELEVSYWSMIGTWVAGIATFLAVLTSLYLSTSARKTRLSIRIRNNSKNGYELILLNRAHVYAEVESINLVFKQGLFKKVSYDSYFSDLVTSIFEDVEGDAEKLKIHPSSPSKSVDISFDNLCVQYNTFLPYNPDGELTKPIKMPKCYVGVYLTSGEVFYKKLPDNFYVTYRENIGSQFELDIFHCSNEPDKYFVYESSGELYEKQQEYLEQYTKSRRNYHLLF